MIYSFGFDFSDFFFLLFSFNYSHFSNRMTFCFYFVLFSKNKIEKKKLTNFTIVNYLVFRVVNRVWCPSFTIYFQCKSQKLNWNSVVSIVLPLPHPDDPKQHEACCPLCKKHLSICNHANFIRFSHTRNHKHTPITHHYTRSITSGICLSTSIFTHCVRVNHTSYTLQLFVFMIVNWSLVVEEPHHYLQTATKCPIPIPLYRMWMSSVSSVVSSGTFSSMW